MSIEHGDSLPCVGTQEYAQVFEEVVSIRDKLVSEAVSSQALLDQIHSGYRESARNLLYYLALRHRDLRPLQMRLAALGLSSLGRAESHVLATIDAVLELLQQLTGASVKLPAQEGKALEFNTGERLLREHTEALLGVANPGRGVQIMVTMPSEAASDYELVHQLLQQGMDCMRINCAHDDPAAWSQMIAHLRRAELSLGKTCRVVMDLAGPKLRTGPLEPGPAVVKVRPRRDVFGKVIAPARIWLYPSDQPAAPPAPADACLPVDESCLKRLQIRNKVRLIDARHSRRSFRVVDQLEEGCWAEAKQTTYILPGTTLRQRSKTGKRRWSETKVADVPARENSLLLHQGDQLIVTRDLVAGRAAVHDSAGQILTPARIGCTIPTVFDDVQAGESIWFDDGKIGGVIEKVEPDQVLVRITRTRLQGTKLRSDKGINLPESQLNLAALTDKDLEDLTFVARHANVVELSFANRASDVEQLQEQLARLGGRSPAIVLKIETRQGFENLPDMLLTAMRSACCGVMIARGDLAVECGFERLAEVQEEILWICEAAHVPVIWATQVLETLAKEGMPSRAEITDAAMGHRAECVMLNKGPHVLHAVKTLDDILRRMQAHQTKKRSMLRELRLSTHTRQPPVKSDRDS
ncbi:pyruvate kinase [Gimesia sp.]|uniref:pyruvate kinase n=1 Tax=Gimesia sp. TaxID=2024833 RepID=UPI003A93E240